MSKSEMPKRYYSQNPDEYFVYFAGYSKYVKIGSSNQVRVRLSELQVANPHKIELFHCIPVKGGRFGSRDIENEFQIMFKEHKVRGEWFLKKPVMDFLENNLFNAACNEFELPHFKVARNEDGGWFLEKKKDV